MSQGPDKEPVRQAVTTGISDDKDTEILSGVTANEKIVVKAQKYALPTADTAKNPFLPSRNRSSNKK